NIVNYNYENHLREKEIEIITNRNPRYKLFLYACCVYYKKNKGISKTKNYTYKIALEEANNDPRCKLYDNLQTFEEEIEELGTACRRWASDNKNNLEKWCSFLR
ncbi:MAG: hypothetical protein C4539_08975, partial [Ignavibacteriales bacterium]